MVEVVHCPIKTQFKFFNVTIPIFEQMNYQETVAYLYDQLPLYSCIGTAAYKEDITNTVKLCAAIGNPQNKIKTIHVAGTNGKGSTSHMLAAIFQSSGYRTGLYTSPHLHDFRERIRLNGELISREFIVSFIDRIRSVSEEIKPSFFELTVAMALEYFVEESVDIAIIETGLGGRLDSTNIILPELSIITNIGYDHMNILGDTLEQIAFEKAGIIKPNVPVIIGEALDNTLPVFSSRAAQCNAPLLLAEDSFKILSTKSTTQMLEVTVRDLNTQIKDSYALDLNGIYQQKNLRTVLTAINVLRTQGFIIPDSAIEKALRAVKILTGLRGRWDVINENPLIVLDVAHNADGMEQVLHQIRSTTYKNLHIIFGMVKDKAIEKILKLLPADAIYYFTKANIPRALNENELSLLAAQYGLVGRQYPHVNMALLAAKEQADVKDLILVCGSVFLVGEVEVSG